MVSILEGSLAKTIGRAASFLFLDATLIRQTPATTSADPADPDAPTEATYTCKAIADTFSVGLMAGGLVNDTDVNVLILASTLAVEPLPLDKITIRGKTYTITSQGVGRVGAKGLSAVTTDPAKAVWSCRCV